MFLSVQASTTVTFGYCPWFTAGYTGAAAVHRFTCTKQVATQLLNTNQCQLLTTSFIYIYCIPVVFASHGVFVLLKWTDSQIVETMRNTYQAHDKFKLWISDPVWYWTCCANHEWWNTHHALKASSWPTPLQHNTLTHRNASQRVKPNGMQHNGAAATYTRKTHITNCQALVQQLRSHTLLPSHSMQHCIRNALITLHCSVM